MGPLAIRCSAGCARVLGSDMVSLIGCEVVAGAKISGGPSGVPMLRPMGLVRAP